MAKKIPEGEEFYKKKLTIPVSASDADGLASFSCVTSSLQMSDGLFPVERFTLVDGEAVKLHYHAGVFPVAQKPLLPCLASNMFIEKKKKNALEFVNKVNSDCSHFLHVSSRPFFQRPKWPFYPWREVYETPNIDDKAFLSELDPFFRPQSSSINGEDIFKLVSEICPEKPAINTKFIHGMFTEAECRTRLGKSPECLSILQTAQEIVNCVCETLGQKFKLFENYKVLQMGSSKEGTKLGPPDEFDYMIELPQLREQLNFQEPDKDLIAFTKNHQSGPEERMIKVKRRIFFDDIRKNARREEDIKINTDRDFMKIIWNDIQMEMASILRDILPSNMTWLDTVPCYNSTFAMTHTMLWRGEEYPHLVLHFDICLSVPLDSRFCSGIDRNQDILDRTRQGLVGSPNGELFTSYTHALLNSDGGARWTRATQEMEILEKIDHDDGRKHIYRCAKYAVSKLAPKVYNNVLHRLDSLIPSYWLKTVLFYMITHYGDDKFWGIDSLPLRLVEMFLVLKKCLDKKQLSSYFVPHNVVRKYLRDAKLTEVFQKMNESIDLICHLLCLESENDETCVAEKVKALEDTNKKLLSEGLLQSVIELCCFYAFNDFSEECFAGLQTFVKTYFQDELEIRGSGEKMQLWYMSRRIDINAKLAEKGCRPDNAFI